MSLNEFLRLCEDAGWLTKEAAEGGSPVEHVLTALPMLPLKLTFMCSQMVGANTPLQCAHTRSRYGYATEYKKYLE